jgi:hypothetical protein
MFCYFQTLLRWHVIYNWEKNEILVTFYIGTCIIKPVQSILSPCHTPMPETFPISFTFRHEINELKKVQESYSTVGLGSKLQKLYLKNCALTEHKHVKGCKQGEVDSLGIPLLILTLLSCKIMIKSDIEYHHPSCVSLYLSICLCLAACICICLFVWICLSVSVCLAVYACISVYVCGCLSVYVWLSVWLSVSVSVSLWLHI